MPHAQPLASAPRRLRPALLGSLVFFMTFAAAARAQEPAPPVAVQPSPAPESAPAVTLTFEEALARALAANPGAATVRAGVTAAEAEARLLRTAIFPRVDLSGTATRNSDEVAFQFEDIRSVILPENDWTARVTLAQPLYAGGRELKAIRQARLATDGARQDVRQSEDGLIFATAADYLAVVAADALVDVERQNLELAQRRRKQSQDFYEAGESTKVDVLRAETAIKAAERRLAAAREQRGTAASRLRLDLALDGDLDQPLAVAEPRIQLPPLPSEEELVRRAELARPEVRRGELESEIARLEVGKQRGRYLPTVRAEVSYLTQRASFPADAYGAFTINLDVPIFDSGETASRVATAETRQQQAALRLEETKRGVREAVRQALLDLETARTNLALAREQLAAAEAEHEQTFELYRAQEATSLDAQAAESSLVEARRAVVAGGLDQALAELEVWLAAGSLKDTLGIAVQEDAP